MRERYCAGDAAFLSGMTKLANVAEEGHDSVLGDSKLMAELLRNNFSLGLHLGEHVVCNDNLSFVNTAND